MSQYSWDDLDAAGNDISKLTDLMVSLEASNRAKRAELDARVGDPYEVDLMVGRVRAEQRRNRAESPERRRARFKVLDGGRK